MNDADLLRVTLFCYGNPAREDDGIGPALAERPEITAIDGLRIECNYQLFVEDAITLSESDLVVFADASISGREPFSFRPVPAKPARRYDTHDIDPPALIALCEELYGRRPDAYALAIRGYSFQMFQTSLSERAAANLAKAADFLVSFLRERVGAYGAA